MSFLELAEAVLRAATLTSQATQAVSEAVQAIDRAKGAFATDDLVVLEAMLARTHAETIRVGEQLDAALAARQTDR
ncbi:hypothetical protein HY78_00440 [Rhizorhabdus wittichii DC-6]|nr:hypothetical protein HY78_00440 [Rhizorhabdus wittichii DC-6]